VPHLLVAEQSGASGDDNELASIGAFEDRAGGAVADASSQPPPPMSSLFAQMCALLRGKWLDVMRDAHGSYLVRDILAVLGGHVDVRAFLDASNGGGAEPAVRDEQQLTCVDAQLYFFFDLHFSLTSSCPGCASPS